MSNQTRSRRLFAGILAFFFTFCPVIASPLTGGGGGTPAEQTELAQSGRSLKQDIFSPVKGLATNVADTLRDGDYAKVLNNLHQFVRGVWTSRGAGWTKQNNSAFNSGGAFLELSTPLNNSDGTTTYIFQNGSKLYTYDLTTATQVGTGFSTGAAPCFTPTGTDGTPYVVRCDGTGAADEPYYWHKGIPGGNFSYWSIFPSNWGGAFYFTKPRYVENTVGDRLAWGGFVALPNTVLISATNKTFTTSSPQVATDAGYITVSSSLGPITGLRAVRINEDTSVLLVGCSRGLAMITGTDATNFKGVEITREFGVPSNRTWIEIGDTLYFLATDGIRALRKGDGLNATRFVRVSTQIQDVVNRIATTYASKSFVAYNPAKQEVQWWVPVDSDTTPQHAIVMSCNTQDPGSGVDATPVFSTADGISPTCAAYWNGNVIFGRSDGYLMTGYSGNDWDGTAINWDYVSPLIGAGSPSQNASNRKWVIMTEGGDQSFTAEAYTLQSMSDGKQKFIAQDTRAISQTAASVPNLGTWQSSSTTTTYPKLFDFDSRGSGRYWTLRLKGTTSGQHIDLVGVQSILTVGGFKQ